MRLLGGLACLACAAFAQPAAAQWFDWEKAGLPTKADGTFNPDAPAPKMPDGKPDFSGMWSTVFDFANADPEAFTNPLKYFDETDKTPFQPWARDLTRRRIEREGLDTPASRCVPTGYLILFENPPIMKFSQQSDYLIMLFEPAATFRQVFMDGRPMPDDPLPTYMGYSIARWDGETLIVETAGFNDKLWIDNEGRPTTEKLRVTERWQRPSFGKIEVEITIDDPGAYTQPWTRKKVLEYRPKGELAETYCDPNDNDFDEQLEELKFEVE